MIFLRFSFLFFIALASARAAELSFDYDRSQPIDVQQTSERTDGGVVFRDISYAQGSGRNAATIIAPEKTGASHPAILFVHWYGPPEPSSNRTQFIPDATELAKHGAVSLLIDTPWSRAEYFQERTRDGDYARSVQEVKNLRRALDVLVAQPGIDRARVAYVGHDFGAMYGALAVASDTRVHAFVFMAGTQSFSDWFLYGKPKLEGEPRQKFVNELAPLDPVRYLPKIKMPTLLQFADNDIHVSKEHADAVAAASAGAKTVRVYHAEHELNADATRDRIAWLKEQLKLE